MANTWALEAHGANSLEMLSQAVTLLTYMKSVANSLKCLTFTESPVGQVSGLVSEDE